MPAVSHRHQMIYVPVPKVACTSIKTAFYCLDSGRDVADLERMNAERNIVAHQMYPSVIDGRLPAFAEHYWSFAVVRDPVGRFVSGYKNRILHHRDLVGRTMPRLGPIGLPATPTFDEFVRWFPVYFHEFGLIRQHFAPQSQFLRRVIDDLDDVYRMDELDRLAGDLGTRVGHDVVLPHRQAGGGQFDVEVEERHVHRIEAYMVDDYRLLAPYGITPTTAAPRLGRVATQLLSPKVYDSLPVRTARGRRQARQRRDVRRRSAR